MNESRQLMIRHRVDAETLQSRYALRVVACLSTRSEQTSHDVDERLRVARERALDRARAQRAAAPGPVVLATGGGTATLAFGGGPASGSPWWIRLGTALPLLALVLGLVLIQSQHARLRTAAIAEVDVDLLVDELPPKAYSDPGFVEFLKAARE